MSACDRIAVVPSSQDNSARMGTVTPFPPDDPQAGSGATALVVVDGATLACDKGSAPSTLVVTSGTQGSAENKLVAVTADHAAGTNIQPFGTCSILGGPCQPSTPAKWISPVCASAGTDPVLVVPAKLLCAVGGIIGITDPNQTTSTLNVSGLVSITDLDMDTLALALGLWTEVRDGSTTGEAVPGMTERQWEMTLVGGVMMNRMSTGYRGSETMVDTILDPWQFSEFNTNSRNPQYREMLESGNPQTVLNGMGQMGGANRDAWCEAMRVSSGLMNGTIANPWESDRTRHYYSPQVGLGEPNWAAGETPLTVDGVDSDRLQFYDGIR